MSSSNSVKGSDDTHWSTSYTSKDGQSNDLSGKVGSGEHCHMYREESGKAGVVHRGECKVCDDNTNSSSSGK